MSKLEKLKIALNYHLEDDDLILLVYDLYHNRDFDFDLEILNKFDLITEDNPLTHNSYIRKYIEHATNEHKTFKILLFVYTLSEITQELSVSEILYLINNIGDKNVSGLDIELHTRPIIDTRYKELIYLYKNHKRIPNIEIKYNRKDCLFIYYINGERNSFFIKKGDFNAIRK